MEKANNTHCKEKPSLEILNERIEPPDSAKSYRHDRDKVSWWAVFYKAAPDAIGIGGLKYAFNPSEVRWRRLCWLILILAAFGVNLYHVIRRGRHLATHPSSVDIYTNHTDSLTFPTVAICNYNAFKNSTVAGTELGDFLIEVSRHPRPPLNASSPYATLFNNVTLSYLFTKYGHQLEETIIYANWKYRLLDHSNFTVKITDWGLCFTFNDADSGNPPLTVNRPGRAHGLYVMLDAKEAEDFIEPAARLSTGFQVLVYEYGSAPLVEDQGFGIAPGTHTQAIVEVTETSNLQPRYGLCEDKDLEYYEKYGYSECFIECRTDYFYEACGCKFFALPIEEDEEECTAWEYFACGGDVYDEFVNNHTCDCPVPCHTRSYHPIISTTAFPSRYWENWLKTEFSIPDGYAKDNLCFLSIYFKEMSIQQITQNIDYDFFGFLCDLGGSLGLWLGGSIITFFELFDLLGHSIYVYSKGTRTQEKR